MRGKHRGTVTHDVQRMRMFKRDEGFPNFTIQVEPGMGVSGDGHGGGRCDRAGHTAYFTRRVSRSARI